MPDTHSITVAGGISIPGDLEDRLVQLDSVTPNSWNPNKMDSSMSAKLERAITKDGFTTPVLVRPVPDNRKSDSNAHWEIVDGEHRWRAAQNLGMKELPVINLGPISDSQAKQITVKANALKGEFDSVDLAEMIKELSDDVGLAALEDDLPYTGERLKAFVDLLSTDTSGALNMGSNDDKPDSDTGKGDDTGQGDGDQLKDQFKSFDGNDMKFDHKCPRCGFEFNEKDAK